MKTKKIVCLLMSCFALASCSRGTSSSLSVPGSSSVPTSSDSTTSSSGTSTSSSESSTPSSSVSSSSISSSSESSISSSSVSSSVISSSSSSSAADVYLSTITGQNKIAIRRTETLTAALTKNGVKIDDGGFEWAISDSSIATIDAESGLLTAVKVGTATVTATPFAVASAVATFAIEVVYPDIDIDAFGIANDYHMWVVDATDSTNATKGYVTVDDNSYLWYASAPMATSLYGITHAVNLAYYLAEGKVFSATITGLNADKSAYVAEYYYQDYLADDAGTPVSDTDFKAGYNGTNIMKSADWEYLGYNSKQAIEFFGSVPKEEGAIADQMTLSLLAEIDPTGGLLKYYSDSTKFSSVMTYLIVNKDGSLNQYQLLAKPVTEGADYSTIYWGYFQDVGTNVVIESATKIYFRDDGDPTNPGDGEGFDTGLPTA